MKYRKLITVVCLLLAPVFAIADYYTKIPTHTSLEKSFRQAERANMVGPSQIVTTIRDKKNHYDLIAARTDYGVLVYTRSALAYRKFGDTPVIMAGHTYSISATGDTKMPVFLFHKSTEAASARLELRIPDIYKENPDYVYLLDSEEAYDGLFRFTIRIPNGSLDATNERNALSSFYHLCCGHSNSLVHAVPATVWLYDAQGNLLETREITVQTPAKEAHAERDDLS